MKKIKLCIWIICTILSFNSCAPLKDPIIISNADISSYKYIYITPTQVITSSSGGIVANQFGVYDTTDTKSINPSDIISGVLLKQGYIIIPHLNSELFNDTLIVNYGESGRRNRGLGYTIEVTIQFISAKTNELIYSCTAEGQGSKETDDIRIAINRALSSIPSKKIK